MDGQHGSHEQRLALTYIVSRQQPTSVPFIPRLLWHRFYNYDPLPGNTSQEDAHELILKWFDTGSVLHTVASRTDRPYFVCQNCQHNHPLAGTEYGTVITLDLLGEAEQEGAPRTELRSVQEAFDAYFEPTPVVTSAAGILEYNDKPWACEQCHSTRLPKKGYHIESSPDCLILHLKRWREDDDAARAVQPRVRVVNHQIHVDDTLRAGNANYDLRSVLRQSDDCRSGHYFANCFFNGCWWYYNDTCRRELRPEEDTMDATSKSYIVIYDRRQ